MGYGSFELCDRCGRREEGEAQSMCPIRVLHGDEGEEGYVRTSKLFCQDCWRGEIGIAYDLFLGTLGEVERPSAVSPDTTEEELQEARQVAVQVLGVYGEGGQHEADSVKRGMIWNDHPAVQAALTVIQRRRG